MRRCHSCDAMECHAEWHARSGASLQRTRFYERKDMRPARLLVGFLLSFAIAMPCVAVTTAGSGTVIVVPVVAQTSSYNTEVFVRNPNSAPITVNVKFYEALTSSIPGLHSCSQLPIPALLT